MNESEFIKNNDVILIGEIAGELTYSHEVFGEKFYLFDLEIERLSGISDFVPVMVSDRLIDVHEDYTGYWVKVQGQFRSHNQFDGEKRKLVLSVFARDIESVDTVVVSPEANQIDLEGYICKEPVYRKTPLGREIAEILLAVNRPYGKSDYIPCICWGRNARFTADLQVGEKLRVSGRIQSRTYMKKLDECRCEERIAYEVSISKEEVITNEK